jgi:DNA-binding transcriptional LysR family regulator
MSRDELPPLSTLQAFEAAGRHLSFTRAATELNVTQAAISKQIRLLEERLGTRLFLRSHRRVQLTAEGREYLHTVVTALTHIAHATLELRAKEAPRRLCIAGDESIGALWLMPRLKRLLRALPEATLDIVVSDEEARLLAEPVDLAILHGQHLWPGHDSERLFDEVVFPVCSPAYRRRLPRRLSPADLARAQLIDLGDENWTWINWRIWLTDHGVGLPATHRALTIGRYPLVMEAARRGIGVALAWQSLIEDDLAAGTLVRPLAAEVRTRFGYYLAWPRTRAPSTLARRCMDWIKSEFANSPRPQTKRAVD